MWDCQRSRKSFEPPQRFWGAARQRTGQRARGRSPQCRPAGGSACKPINARPPDPLVEPRRKLLSPRLLAILRDYWWVAKPSTWLFLGRDPLLPITTRRLHQILCETTEALEINKRVTPQAWTRARSAVRG